MSENYEVIREKFGDDRNLVVHMLLREAAQVLNELRKLIASLEGRKTKEWGRSCEWIKANWNYMIVDTEIAFSQILIVAGCLSFTREFPLLDFEDGANSDAATTSHLRTAVAKQRPWLDTFLSSLTQMDGRPISIQRLCTTQQGVVLKQRSLRHVIWSASIIGEVYLLAPTLGDVSPFRASSETGDGTLFFQLALALSLRTLGSGHMYTKKLAHVLSNAGGYDGLEERDRLEGDVNAWLSGGYEYLYLSELNMDFCIAKIDRNGEK